MYNQGVDTDPNTQGTQFLTGPIKAALGEGRGCGAAGEAGGEQERAGQGGAHRPIVGDGRLR